MFFYDVLNKLFPRSYFGTKLRFYKKLGYSLNLDSPSSFNEKTTWRKLYDKNPLFPICADKIKVRDYVKDKVGAEYLIPELYVGDAIDIDTLQTLEGEFVVKANHNSGPVQLVNEQDKNPESLARVVSSIKMQLSKPYAVKNNEWWYEQIPRGVIVERLLRNAKGHYPEDYKFFVFNRADKTEIITQVIYDRQQGVSATFYDEDLKPLPFSTSYKNDNIAFAKPENFEEMIVVAKKLGEDFDFCRVDLYNVDGKIYFGELTFSPAGGTANFKPIDYDFWLGEKWELRK